MKSCPVRLRAGLSDFASCAVTRKDSVARVALEKPRCLTGAAGDGLDATGRHPARGPSASHRPGTWSASAVFRGTPSSRTQEPRQGRPSSDACNLNFGQALRLGSTLEARLSDSSAISSAAALRSATRCHLFRFHGAVRHVAPSYKVGEMRDTPGRVCVTAQERRGGPFTLNWIWRSGQTSVCRTGWEGLGASRLWLRRRRRGRVGGGRERACATPYCRPQ